tara:strand:+ start:44 stop:1381 length:1338 start_codon:yes stop_codon:yes gene_type:complete
MVATRAKSSIGTDIYSQVVEIINDNLYDLGISVRQKDTKGAWIYLDCEHDRVETQDELEALLDKISGTKKLRVASTKSSVDFTLYSKGSDEVRIVYKGRSGGMSSTTLNASITELFPAVAFELGLPKTVNKETFYNKIYNEGMKLGIGGVYKNKTAQKAGREVISTAKDTSSLFNEKLGNALDLFKYIMDTYDRKKIDKIVWGYRNNTKPTGVKPNHKGDIFLVFDDGQKTGLSIKATSGGQSPPQFNSYVRAIYNSGSFNKLKDFEKLKKVSYDNFYKNIIVGIPPFSDYGKPKMTALVGKFEKGAGKKNNLYDKVYDEQLAWLKQTVMDLLKSNPEKTKDWLLKEVCAEQEDVPLIVLHATKTGVHTIDDEEEIKMCVKVSLKGKQGVEVESGSGKQDFFVILKCKGKPTKLAFSIRTNKAGIAHKLGQYINLAVKFNGIAKK